MKGFFSFIIILLLTIFLINLSIFFTNQDNEKKDIINTIIEIEQHSTKRILLENNVDKIIKITLNELLINDNFNLINAKNSTNTRLFNYLKNRAFEYDLFFENKKDLEINSLNQITSVELIEMKNMKFAYFYFTGGELRNKNIATIFGQNFKLKFKIPHGYNIKVVIFSA